MASVSSRPLPPAPDPRAQAESVGSCSDKEEDVSLFSHASGPMQINDGDFSAIKGDRYGRVSIFIQQGGPRSMKPRKAAPARQEESASGSGIQSPTGIRPREALPLHEDHKDTDAELLAELSDQIARWKERKKHLDIRAAELVSWERDLAAQTEEIQAKEHHLRQKEQQLVEQESAIKEREEHLDYVRRNLSAKEDYLAIREERLRKALDDLRLRERTVNEQTSPTQWAGCGGSLSSISDTLTSTKYVKDNTLEDPSNPNSLERSQKITPNRRSALLPDTPPISHTDETIVPNGTNLVRVTHTWELLTPPDRFSERPSTHPLAPLGDNAEDQGSSEDEGYVNDLDAWSDSSSTEDLLSIVEPDIFRPDLSGVEDGSIMTRPPTYRESPDPSPHHGPVKAKRAQQLQDLITVLKVVSEDEPSGKVVVPTSTAFSGALLREHVEDIEHIHDWAERAQAISWAIEMMIEKGRFDEHTICTLCDRVSENGQSANVAVLVLKREMGRSHLTLIPLNAIRLLQTMLANTASIFREHCSLPHFMSLLENMVCSEETNPAVRARAREVIKIIKHGHGASPQFNVSRSNGAWENSAIYGLAY